MSRKYENLHSLRTFDHSDDPYPDRRGTGSVRPAEPLPQDAPGFLRSFDERKTYYSWLGHSSVFLAIQGKTVLVDPIFSQYASPVPLSGLKRFPGRTLTASDFPDIDCLIITHNHYDHCDKPTIRMLSRQVKHCIVPAGVGALIAGCGIPKERITELGWYQQHRLEGLRITCTPSQHFSARGPFDRNKTLWGSFVIQSGENTVFLSGDGGYSDHFDSVYQRFGAPDLAIMECGQYNIRWRSVHMFPEESAEAAAKLHAGMSIPVHWGAFVLSDHPWDDPPKRFRRRAEEIGLPYRIPVLNRLYCLQEDNCAP